MIACSSAIGCSAWIATDAATGSLIAGLLANPDSGVGLVALAEVLDGGVPDLPGQLSRDEDHRPASP
jgi:hypothetical protein